MFNTNPWLAFSSTSNRIKSTYIQGFLDICGNIVLRNGGFSLPNGDVSMNGNLYVGLDASFNRRVNVKGTSTFNDDIYQLDGSYNINISSAVGTFPNYGTTQNGNRLINVGSGNFNLTSTGLNDSIAIGNAIISASNPTGFGHIGVGKNVFPALTSGFQNIGIGNTIATLMTTGNNNVFIGNGVATSTTSTGNTVAIGTAAGKSNTTGISNTYLGSFTDANAGTYNNSTALGYGATITKSNQIKLGTSNESVDISSNLNVSGIASMLGYIGMKVVGCSYKYNGASGISRTISTDANKTAIVKIGSGGYDTVSYDSGHVDANGFFNVPVAGYYICYGCGALRFGDERTFTLVTKASGAETYRSGTSNNKTVNDANTTVSVTAIVKCGVGDSIFFRTGSNTASSTGIILGADRRMSNCFIFLLSTY
jgi:hypothetical protein